MQLKRRELNMRVDDVAGRYACQTWVVDMRVDDVMLPLIRGR